MKTKIKRPGAGRSKGSFSFVKMTLAELVGKYVDTGTITDLSVKFPGLSATDVVLGRKWAEGAGFKVTSASATEIAHQIDGKAPGTGVAVTETAL
jgi:hypothetical protein